MAISTVKLKNLPKFAVFNYKGEQFIKGMRIYRSEYFNCGIGLHGNVEVEHVHSKDYVLGEWKRLVFTDRKININLDEAIYRHRRDLANKLQRHISEIKYIGTIPRGIRLRYRAYVKEIDLWND